MRKPTLGVFFCVLFVTLAASAIVSAQTAPKAKLAASAIQIAMVEAGDIQIPAEFRFAVYERLVQQVRASGLSQRCTAPAIAPPMAFRIWSRCTPRWRRTEEGSQTKRELTTVFGATKVDVTASVTARDGHSLMDQKITGRVRFFGENLGVTNDLAKRISKLVRQTF